MTNRESAWTGGQYSLYRVLFGAYLCTHFACLLPWGTELFSSEGVLPDAALSPLAALFPNLLAWVDAPWVVTGMLLLATVASIGFAAGWRDKVMAACLFYVWACLFGRNPLIGNPSLRTTLIP